MICFYHQWKISQHVSAGSPLPEFLLRHTARCPRCQAHHAAQSRISRLLAEAQGPVPPPPPYLRERILRAVAADAADEEPHPWIAPAFSRAILGVALLVVALTLVKSHLLPQPQAPAPATLADSQHPSLGAQASPPPLPSLPVQSAFSLLDASLASPYETEWVGLKESLAQMGGFLAGCLPQLPTLDLKP